MWTIIKIDKKRINFLNKDFKKKLGSKFQLYNPKIKISKFKKNKLINEEVSLLGDYLFCYFENFENKMLSSDLKFSRGLKYFLNGFVEMQEDIKNFVNKCKKYENDSGYISHNFFKIEKDKNYKFSTGPFSEKIFQIVGFNKNKIDILLGGMNLNIKKDKYLFSPV
jgi:hypothetical protein